MFSATPDRILFVRIYCVMLLLSVSLGVIFFGQSAWFENIALTGPREIVSWVPVDPWKVWGVTSIAYAASLVAVLGKSVAIHFLRAGAVGYTFFAVSLAWPRSGYTLSEAVGVVVFLAIGILQIFVADYLQAKGWE